MTDEDRIRQEAQLVAIEFATCDIVDSKTDQRAS